MIWLIDPSAGENLWDALPSLSILSVRRRVSEDLELILPPDDSLLAFSVPLLGSTPLQRVPGSASGLPQLQATAVSRVPQTDPAAIGYPNCTTLILRRRGHYLHRRPPRNDNNFENEWNNQTAVTEFLLMGFPIPNNIDLLPFTILLVIYILSITTNLLVIIIVQVERSLQKPMYIFISGFSFLEICYTSVTVPRLLWSLATKQKSISSTGCFAQFYFHFSFGATENLSLSIMAYDRYVAICNPLRYSVIMTMKTCTILLLSSWISGFMVMIFPCIQLSALQFCGHKEIDHYYCDFAPLVKLSCSEISHIENLFFITACFIIMGCFVLIILSYVWIIHTTIKLPTASGRFKAFSTCASHCIVVMLFYGTTSFMFLRTKTGHFLKLNKIISIFPSIVTPLLNPIIYTLRNQEVKEAVKKTIKRINRYRQRDEDW
ncbi:olfactory receptor 2AP1-like [Discoglossus pictus]